MNLDTKEQRSSNYPPGKNLLSKFIPGRGLFFIEHQFKGVVKLKKGENGVEQKINQSKIETYMGAMHSVCSIDWNQVCVG